MDEKQVRFYKENYLKSTRITLLSMHAPRLIPSGTKGTVDHADDIETLHCTFDNRHCLGVCLQEDIFTKIKE